MKVPVEVEKIIERERIVHVRDNENQGGNLIDLFSALINCKLDVPSSPLRTRNLSSISSPSSVSPESSATKQWLSSSAASVTATASSLS